MKKGLILINAYSTLESSLNQSNRLKAELEALGVAVDIRNNNFFATSIADSEIAAVSGYDFCIYLDKDKYVGAMLENSGLRLFNSSTAIAECDDKMTTYIRLAGKGIPIVDTLPGLLCYTPNSEISTVTVDRIEETLGYPVIVKECYGSLGKGVYKCDNRTELVDTMNRLKMIPHLFQRCVDSSLGRDIRVIVVGDKCISAMIRESTSDFRSNIELGGHGTPTPITEEIERICLAATRELGLDYAGIDLLFTEKGLAICEVNSNAFFGGIEAVTGVNVARAYAKYIVEEVYNTEAIAILRDSLNHISITNLARERVRKNLNVNLLEDDILDIIRRMILDECSHISQHGENYYIEENGVKFTVDASTMMIITAKRTR